jgi:RNA polymerase sigma-70 factor (ECF subfamily)
LEVQQEIIDAVIAGDQAAFEGVVNQYADQIFRYVRNLVRDEHAAEDVAQRVFLSVYQNLRQFDPGRGKFGTWLFRIARNAALNHLRDSKRSTVPLETPLPQASHELAPPEQAELREQFSLLDRAVAALPEHQRSAWVLSELEGLTQSEIALIEDVPEGTVKSRVSRARDSLRKTLADQIGLER